MKTSATRFPSVCRSPAARILPWTRRSSANASGPGPCIARPACWWDARGRWSRPAKDVTGRCWRNIRRASTACSIRSAICAARRKCCCCARAFAAGGFMITFAAMPRRLYASPSWAHARRCCITTGRDLAAALRTIIEVGDCPSPARAAISDAFPGSRLEIAPLQGARFAIEFIRKGCCDRCRLPSCRTGPCVICCWSRRC